MRGITRELSLACDGLMTVATVTDVSESDVSFNGVPQWRIRYRFYDQRGREHFGESGPTPKEEAHDLHVGSQGTVRFDSGTAGIKLLCAGAILYAMVRTIVAFARA